MKRTSSTRARKNAKRLFELAPHLLPRSADRPGRSVPPGILKALHRLPPDRLRKLWRGDPELLTVAEKMRAEYAAGRSRSLFRDPPFFGNVFFIRLQIVTSSGSVFAHTNADVQTAIQYATLAARPLVYYCGRYGGHERYRLDIQPSVIPFSVSGPDDGVYDDDRLQGWVNDIAAALNVDRDHSCIVILNPRGAVNTKAKLSDGHLGYHDKADLPYCFVNVTPGMSPLTVQDVSQRYAETLSHELAEMLVDPDASFAGQEVCDACAGNCDNEWLNFFVIPDIYVGSAQPTETGVGLPASAFHFYTAAVAPVDEVDKCSSPHASGCGDFPGLIPQASVLLFYDNQAGLGEFYSVNRQGQIDRGVQPAHTDWRTTWSEIVFGNFAVAGRTSNLLFYDASAGTGEFWLLDASGHFSLVTSISGWRDDWTTILPGKFSDHATATDLLFYEGSTGTGEFWSTAGGFSLLGTNEWNAGWSAIVAGNFGSPPYTNLFFYSRGDHLGQFWHTDGQGGLAMMGPPDTGVRDDWSIVIPGKFGPGPYTDLLFYQRESGIGDFWEVDGHGGLKGRIGQTNFGWRNDWTKIVACRVSGGLYDDLLFYEAATGDAEFNRTTGQGTLQRIRAHSGWRPSWNTILSLPVQAQHLPYLMPWGT